MLGRKVLAVIGTTWFLAVSCGGGTASEAVARPGEGIAVTMARATWSTGYFQAEIYRQLVQELGYEVNVTLELDPAEFYTELAQGRIDFWVNGWFPIHEMFLEEELEDGSLVADNVIPLGIEIAGGALQGIMIDSATATEASITRLADIGKSPQIAALVDTDGDGLANLVGCDVGWGCQVTLDNLIAESGWSTTIEQDSGTYDTLWGDAMMRLDSGEPVLAYTWSPSGYLSDLTPGDSGIWLSVSSPDDDVVGGGGLVLPPRECPGQPCDLGFPISDVRVVANVDFVAANPVLSTLFELIGFQLSDIVPQNYQMRQGQNSSDDIRRHAREWIQRERRTVDIWLREARAADNQETDDG